MLVSAIKYADSKLAEAYKQLILSKTDLAKQQVSSSQIEYLYMRSFRILYNNHLKRMVIFINRAKSIG